LASTFSLVGLLLTLGGACLLFFYGLPKKKIGNVVIYGISAMQYSDPQERDVPKSEWQPIANAYWRRAKILNSTGFALVALGTLLQVVGVCL
jgi:hypothetical protein